MAQRRQIRVSGGHEGRSERPARRYGATPNRCAPQSNDRLKPVLPSHFASETRMISASFRTIIERFA